MQKFKDTTGREWVVNITIGTFADVRGHAGVDLAEVLGGGLLSRMWCNPALFGNVLFYCCDRKERDTLGGFLSALRGDSLGQAEVAFIDELLDFFPPDRRATIKRIMAVNQATVEGCLTAAEQKTDSDNSSGEPPASSG